MHLVPHDPKEGVKRLRVLRTSAIDTMSFVSKVCLPFPLFVFSASMMNFSS